MKNIATIVFLFFYIGIASAQIPTTNLAVYLKADAGTSTTTDGATVSSWTDQSGNGNNATSPGTQPIYKTNAINGQPAVRFDGGFTYMALPTPSTLGIQNHDYEIFIIAKSSTHAVQFLMGGATENYEIHLDGVSGARFIPAASTYIDQGDNQDYTEGNVHMFNVQASSTYGKIRVDGTDGGSTAADVRSSNGGGLVLGVRAGGTFYFNGDIAEVIIYNTVLSAIDRITVEKYLADKYGMAYSNFAVNSTADVDTGTGIFGTLRYLMNTINTNASSSTSTIDLTSLSGTITLTDALPPINYNTVINGPGQNNLTISGNNLYRPFFIGSGLSPFSGSTPASPTVTIRNITIANGKGTGGDGHGGGGGAAGMGGGMFVNDGFVIIESVTFYGNTAIGGTGALSSTDGGGGGFGASATGNAGGSSGLLGEAVGGGNGGTSTYGNGGNGGFAGGGGGPSTVSGNGGTGGFGGGGGSGTYFGHGAGSLFGGGVGGDNYGGGGGGGGFGGAIFNRNGDIVIKNSTFNRDSTAGGSGFQSGGTYGGAIFNYSGSYFLENITYGTGTDANSAGNQNDIYLYSGSEVKPIAAVSAATNVTSASATINGTVLTNETATTYRFVYGNTPSSLSDTTSVQNAGSSGTVNVTLNLTGLTYGTFYFYRLVTSNSYGADTSDLGSFIYDTTLSKTNLKLWLSAGNGLDTASGRVSGWYDRSGNSNNATQTSSGNRPSIVSNVINGKSVIRFDGSASYLTLPAASTIGIQNSDYEMFVVAKSSSSSIQFLIGTVDNYEVQLNGGLGARFIPSGAPYLDKGSDGQYTNGQAHIVDAKGTSTYGSIRIDGEIGGYSATDRRSSSASALNIGRRSSNAYFLNGDIAEIIIYNADLTKEQRLAITDYLSNKYNITYSTVSEPTVQSSAMSISNSTDVSLKVTVTKGNGSERIILAKSGSAVDSAPSDGSTYTANAGFGSGSQIGTGNYVVYRGSDSVVTVTGLTQHTSYYFASFEVNGNNTDDDYLTTAPVTANQTTTYSAPTVSAVPVTGITLTSAALRGAVNPNGNATTYRFAYGTDAQTLADTTSPQSAGNGTSSDTVSFALSGLSAGTLYYAKCIADNAGGTSASSLRSFITDTTFILSNVRLWLRADQGTSAAADGDSVSTWRDVSGNGNDATQTTSASQPVYKENILNGKPVIRFDGSNDAIATSTTGRLGVTNADYELFVVVKTNSTDLVFIVSAGSEHLEAHINGGLGIRYIPNTGIYVDYGSSNEFNDGSAHLISLRASSSNAILRIDGIDRASSGSSGICSTDATLMFGARLNSGYFLNGDIAECVLYNRNLDSLERSAIETSLAQKYNLTQGTLPVELTTFTATSSRLTVELHWKTVTEIRNAGFEIQRTAAQTSPQQAVQQSAQWTAVGFVEGNGTSNRPNEYSFKDKNTAVGKYLYRLKQIDQDGKYRYSPSVEVALGAVPKQFLLEQNFPNPFNPATTIGFTLEKSGLTTVKVYDVIGREVATLVNEVLEAGTYYQKQFDASHLASGIYFVRLQSDGKQQLRKMYLLK